MRAPFDISEEATQIVRPGHRIMQPCREIYMPLVEREVWLKGELSEWSTSSPYAQQKHASEDPSYASIRTYSVFGK